MNTKTPIILGMLILLSLASVSAVIVNSVEQGTLYPGESSQISLEVKNTLDQDVDDVSMVLNLGTTQFTSVGGSEDSEDEIEEDEEETFNFELKAPSNLAPGDYNIPYTITYTFEDNESTKSGSFGLTVSARTELEFVVESEENIVGETGKVSLKIVNKGLGDIGFVSVKFISASGFEILSTKEEYIGTVRSDDFETATVDALFKKTLSQITAIVTYKDFENKAHSKTVILPVDVYSREKALEIGLIKKSNTMVYVIAVVLIFAIWIIYRKIKKARRKKKLNAEA